MNITFGTTTYNSLDSLYGLAAKLRSLFFSNLYLKDYIIIELMETIRSIVDPISIEFDARDYSFYIKVKKSVMRKKGLIPINSPLAIYENYIKQIFITFINNHIKEVEGMIAASGIHEDSRTTINRLLADDGSLVNMCHITYISDNIFIIKL